MERSDRRTGRRSVWIAVLVIAAATAGCGSDSRRATTTSVWFPPEKSAADFPGVDYPAHEGAPTSPSGTVWWVGIDGATWDLILPAVEAGELPTFARLMEGGAWGTMRSESPSISPALWATMATGVPRHVHGIVNFVEPLERDRRTRPVGPRDRRVPALWDLVGAVGGRTAVLGWFNSFPAEEIAGHWVAKDVDLEAPQARRVYPPSLIERLPQSARLPFSTSDLAPFDADPTIAESWADDNRTLAALRVVTGLERHDLVAVHLGSVDVVQHLTWRDMDPPSQAFPQDGPPRPEFAGMIPGAYRLMDAALARILTWMPEGATLIVVSDHGGGPMTPERAYHLQLDVLLTELGLMDGDDGQVFAIDEMYRHRKRIWLNLDGAFDHGVVSPNAALKMAETIEDRLRDLRTDGGAPVFALVENHTAEPGWSGVEPALSVRFSDEALTAERVTDGSRTIAFAPVRLRHADVSGDHRPEGIFIAFGRGVKPGEMSRPTNLYQVAPTTLRLLGLPQDGRMLEHAPADGGVLTAILSSATGDTTMVATYPGPRASWIRSGDVAVDATIDEDEQERIERLRSLGYLR